MFCNFRGNSSTCAYIAVSSRSPVMKRVTFNFQNHFPMMLSNPTTPVLPRAVKVHFHGSFWRSGLAGIVAFAGLCPAGLPARTRTSADGTKTFEGDLKSCDEASGAGIVTMQNGKLAK